MSNNKLAEKLAQARDKQQQIELAPLAAIATIDEAYAVQSLAASAYSSPQSGYKVGATSEAAQKLFACQTPFYGPMFEAEHYRTGHKLPLITGVLGGEAEFAFKIAEDFPTDRDLTIEDLPALIATAHVAIEIIGRRTLGDGLPPLHAAVADFGSNSAFIEGPSIENWQDLDLSNVTVTTKTNGIETNTGSSAMVMGHPLNSLLWMHNALRAIGSGLKANEWVSTGTCLGVITALPNSTVEVDFRGCGEISYELI